MNKILFAYNIVKKDNQFVARLVEILSNLDNLDIITSLQEFWSPTNQYDYIIINWPEYLFNWRKNINQSDFYKLSIRFDEFKIQGTKIICYLHDEVSHEDNNPILNEIFNLCYSQSDYLIHLGEFTLKKYKEIYPAVQHLAIPHPLFTVFNTHLNKELVRKELGFSSNYFIIIVPGKIRNKEEYQYTLQVYHKIKKKNKKIIFLNKGFEIESNESFLTKCVKVLRRFYLGIYDKKGFLSEEEFSKFMTIADVYILPRINIINSGNIVLCSQFNKPLIGLLIGNIKEHILQLSHIGFTPNEIKMINNNQINSMIESKINKINYLELIEKYNNDQLILMKYKSILK